MGTLYYGDNLDILKRYIKDETVNLVYLDPPFNSAQNYNAFFQEKDGTAAASQIRAFEDTWTWNQESQRVYEELILQPGKVSEVMQAFKTFLGTNDMMAYLAMMCPRLVELRRVLKSTGSLYLHCDPTASHYLKLLLDAVFGQNNYVNAISWKRTTTKNDYQQGAFNWPRIHDIILYYAKDAKTKPTFKQPFSEYGEDYVKAKYPYTDENGRRYGLWDLTAPGSGMRGHPKYELMGVLDREKASIGVLISLQPPTREMQAEAASAGFYEHKMNKQKYPRIQLRTVKELMDGKGIERPSNVAALDETFKKAPKAKAKGGEQSALGL